MAIPSHHEHFEASEGSTRAVRRSVTSVLGAWGCSTVAEDAVIGASELAANAVLHSRGPFDLSMRPITSGARIEIIDGRPDLVPIPVPIVGSAVGVTATGTTGRGLQIVAAVSTRWGFNTSDAFKAVWLEVGGGQPPSPSEPVVELGYRPVLDASARQFTLQGLPVRAAVASGMHVDDLVRELQLSLAWGPSPADRTRLVELLDTSAPARLSGRHAALDAAARGQLRFDMNVELTNDSMAAFGALNELLTELTARVGSAVPEPVAAFRSWLMTEILGQVAGQAPEPCPLPD